MGSRRPDHQRAEDVPSTNYRGLQSELKSCETAITLRYVVVGEGVWDQERSILSSMHRVSRCLDCYLSMQHKVSGNAAVLHETAVGRVLQRTGESNELAKCCLERVQTSTMNSLDAREVNGFVLHDLRTDSAYQTRGVSVHLGIHRKRCACAATSSRDSDYYYALADSAFRGTVCKASVPSEDAESMRPLTLLHAVLGCSLLRETWDGCIQRYLRRLESVIRVGSRRECLINARNTPICAWFIAPIPELMTHWH